MLGARLGGVIGVALRGFLMGSADVVPGVSGGTVALVTGIYQRLVTAISTGSRALGRFARGDVRAGLVMLRDVDWLFLVPLVAGAAAAVLTLARVIETLLLDQPIRMAAVFLGLIIGTIGVAWRILRAPEPRHAVVAGALGVIAFALFGLQSAAATSPPLLAYFVAGALAICAFILPGVSGSFLLLSIGMYQSVLGAVNDRSLLAVAVFAAGATLSLAVFSRVLERLLEGHHDILTAALIGLMIGSVRILWPWPNGLGDENGVGATVLGAPQGDVVIPVILAIAAAVLVVGVSRLAERRAMVHVPT
ncbi:MAG: DUF368 domain-containing protein [Acidimicrobiia bacterium]|nr:DUF368 domain-containing protein [Acidimicrobiia bacterium]